MVALDVSTSLAEKLRRQVGAVNQIELIGAPEGVVFDEWTLMTPDGEVPVPLQQKIRAFTTAGIDIAVLRSVADGNTDLIGGDLNIRVIQDPSELSGYASAVAILSRQVDLPSHVFLYDVGPGGDFHSGRHTSGTDAANEILGLLGTAQVQARAGLAFRAAGADEEAPTSAPFDSAILSGIRQAIDCNCERVRELADSGKDHEEMDLDFRTPALIAAALPPLLTCQGPNGAIAAAPRPASSSDPNYWFFWQRDAAQVAVAMSRLSRFREAGSAQGKASQLVSRYLDFVEQLGKKHDVESLGVSRFDMSGVPIEAYGNPQVDGPAQTVLAVFACVGDPRSALTIARPYLEYLIRFGGSPTFGPWEFVAGDVFFSQYLAHKSLQAASHIAVACSSDELGQSCRAAVRRLEPEILGFLDPARGFVRASRNLLQPFINAISHLDISVVGAVLTGFEADSELLPLDDPLLRRTLWALERSFATRWAVNAAWQRNGNCGMGMGRFPEDMNDGIGATGGNPWTFATLWAAQYYYRLAALKSSGTGDSSDDERGNLLDHADGYLRFVLSHLPADDLTEQIDGQTGLPRGAHHLAWSHAALIDTLLLRRSVVGQRA